ncbi:MAG: tRNA (adenosine(37)-N6)-threonylcarbamoyltransferase complex dimerization subunit type 1 TsaB [bacterium]
MITLVLEASTYAGSAALLDGQAVVAERSVAMRGREHEMLMPAVSDLLAASDLVRGAIGRVVCGAGPGAFTSLRVAASIAKGIAMALHIPLVTVSSLALMVAARTPQAPGRFLAVLDAMRDESYVQLFEVDGDGEMTAIGGVSVIPTAQVDALTAESTAMPVGPGRAGVEFAVPHAAAAVNITKMIDSAGSAILAEWEPGYGRLAEAQVKWEAEHGRPLRTS